MTGNDGKLSIACTSSTCLCLVFKPHQLTPRTLRRSCSRTCAFHKGRMKHLRLLLAVVAVIFCTTVGLFVNQIRSKGHSAQFDGKATGKYVKLPQSLAKTSPKVTPDSARSTSKSASSLGHPFNPDHFDNGTANMRKHYLILYWSHIRGHQARIQSKQEYQKDEHVWPYTYVGDQCPVSCEITNDRSKVKEASAFVVHSRLTDVWDFPPFETLAPWILQNNENPVYTAALSDPRIMSKFNLLISYRLDSDFPSPIYPMPSLAEPIPFGQRLGDVLAVFSKCEVVRTEYMRQLMKYIDVHSYGSCLKNKQGLVGLYGQINGKYIFKDYKLVLSRFYKFSLVFMNQDCDYFVDDRLYHALESGSVPVYMGTDKIDQFLPGNLRNSIIRVRDFSSPQELAQYLKYLSHNETAYNKYLEWKKQGHGDISNTTIGRWWKKKYPLFCQVCMRLAQGGLHPGLSVDTCQPRTFEEWKLFPPYGEDDTEEVYSGTGDVSQRTSNRIYLGFFGVLFGVFVVSVNGMKYVLILLKVIRLFI